MRTAVGPESLRETKSYPYAPESSTLKRKMSLSSTLLRRTKSSIKMLRDMKSELELLSTMSETDLYLIPISCKAFLLKMDVCWKVAISRKLCSF